MKGEKTMKKNETLFYIAVGGLLISAIIFLIISIFSEKDNNLYLYISLGCTLLANIFNLVKSQLRK